jgi:uncharacterized SAM-binding protein YcdF (DUF218 family)
MPTPRHRYQHLGSVGRTIKICSAVRCAGDSEAIIGKAHAIVVLGCSLRDGRPTPALGRRVACGVARWQEGAAPLLVMTGGGDGLTEAAAMAALASKAGVPGAALLLECKARNTVENALNSARLLRARDLSRILLVSDRYHLPRARLLFRAAGLVIAATAHPPPRDPREEAFQWLREAVALPVSLLRLWAAARSQ